MMEKLRAKLKNQGGFTLVEMLIVVAIIAILIASFSGGGLIIPFHGGPLIYGGFFTQATGITIAYIPFIIYGFVVGVLFCCCCWRYCF